MKLKHFLFYICLFLFYIYECFAYIGSPKTFSFRRLWAKKWVQRLEPGPYRWAVRPHNHGGIAQATDTNFLFLKSFYFWDYNWNFSPFRKKKNQKLSNYTIYAKLEKGTVVSLPFKYIPSWWRKRIKNMSILFSSFFLMVLHLKLYPSKMPLCCHRVRWNSVFSPRGSVYDFLSSKKGDSHFYQELNWLRSMALLGEKIIPVSWEALTKKQMKRILQQKLKYRRNVYNISQNQKSMHHHTDAYTVHVCLISLSTWPQEVVIT